MVPKIVKRWNGSAWERVRVLSADPAFEPHGVRVEDYTLEDVFTASGSWEAPYDTTEVQVECWGAGGGGGNATGNCAAGGGGGGAYSMKKVAAIPGNNYDYIIGSGASNQNGGDTSWNLNAVLAKGGVKGESTTGAPPGGSGPGAGGAGGASVDGVGDRKYNGGNGGNGVCGAGNFSGAGGGGAGPTGAGGNALSGTKGIGAQDYGGDGADGVTAASSNINGLPGNIAGGGGSGANRITGGNPIGGAGAAGQIRIRYTSIFTEQYQEVIDYARTEKIAVPSGSQQVWHDNLLKELQDNLGPTGFAKIRRLYMPANNGSTLFGTIDWFNPSTKRASLVNSPTWQSNRGWTGKRSPNRYVTVPFAMNEYATIKNNCSAIAYASAINQLITDGCLFGFQDAGIIFLLRTLGSNLNGAHFNTTTSGTSETTSRGGLYHNRNLTGDMAIFRNTTKYSHAVSPGTDPCNSPDFGFLCHFSDGSGSGGQVAVTIDENNYGSFLILGEAFTDAEHTIIYNAFETYRAKIGLT